jgi:hypothetical protein
MSDENDEYFVTEFEKEMDKLSEEFLDLSDNEISKEKEKHKQETLIFIKNNFIRDKNNFQYFFMSFLAKSDEIYNQKLNMKLLEEKESKIKELTDLIKEVLSGGKTEDEKNELMTRIGELDRQYRHLEGYYKLNDLIYEMFYNGFFDSELEWLYEIYKEKNQGYFGN